MIIRLVRLMHFMVLMQTMRVGRAVSALMTNLDIRIVEMLRLIVVLSTASEIGLK